MSIDVWFDKTASEKSLLVYGTDEGMVNVVQFYNETILPIESFIRATRETNDLMPLFRRKIHSGWCVKVRYYHEITSVISCSSDEHDSVSVISYDYTFKRWSHNSVSVSKGVTSFAYCNFPSFLATGGADRIIRLWNTRKFNRPTASLKGHSAPILQVIINDSCGQVISLSSDKVIKVWDARRTTCLQTFPDLFTHRPEDVISCIHFSPNSSGGQLIASSNTLTPYQLQVKQVTAEKTPKSHDMPLRSAIYNKEFNQILSGCDGGIVNVWDPTNGQKSFTLVTKADGSNREITSMSFDYNYRRLITGGRDGTMTMWNFSNGQPLHSMEGDSHEVTGIMYLKVKGTWLILKTGCIFFKH